MPTLNPLRALALAAIASLVACKDVPPTVPGTRPPCFAWAIDSTLVVVDSMPAGTVVTVKRCLIGRAR